MTDEEKLHEWLRTCPFDWLMVGVIEGLRTVNFDLFSEPPPFAATVISSLSPFTNLVWITAGVLS